MAAADEAVAELSEVRDYLRSPDSFARLGARAPKGVLITGPPGCGKTLLARAVAGESKVAVLAVCGSDFGSSSGDGPTQIGELFNQARAAAPALIVIDEIDAIGCQRGAGLGGVNGERDQTVNQLLVQLDGFSPTDGVVVLATTNRPEVLDRALLRAGRFDRLVTVNRPDHEARLGILRLHARGKPLADAEADLPAIARATPGFTGADLANVLNDAALLALRERAQVVSRSHLEEAVDRALAGPRRKGAVVADADRRRLAYHEAGHALVAAAVGKRALVPKLSLVPRLGGIGHLSLLREDKTVLTRTDIERRIAVALGGLVAEELALGEASTTSEADLERATNAALDLAGRYGMSARAGRAQVVDPAPDITVGRQSAGGPRATPAALEKLDREVRRLLDEQEELARSILAAHRSVLDTVASVLVTRESLQGDDLERLLLSVPRWGTPSRPHSEPVPVAEAAKPRSSRVPADFRY